jgi:hypothetical protein
MCWLSNGQRAKKDFYLKKYSPRREISTAACFTSVNTIPYKPVHELLTPSTLCNPRTHQKGNYSSLHKGSRVVLKIHRNMSMLFHSSRNAARKTYFFLKCLATISTLKYRNTYQRGTETVNINGLFRKKHGNITHIEF